MTPAGSLPLVCVHEDRADYLIGVKLAVLSLARHAPAFQVVVSSPGAKLDFVQWVDRQPNARMANFRHIRQGAGWNVKPSVLLEMLEERADVVWIDSDIVVTGDMTRRFLGRPLDTLLATEETYWGQEQGGDFRTVAWGLVPGRKLRCTVNSGVLRVTRSHVPLLRAWQTMLMHPLYLSAQSRPWYERPLHMIGDQEALTGLLGSQEFAHLPVELLRRGTDIAQCFGPAGFTPGERLRALWGTGPSFIHAMGPKPWLRGERPPPLLRGADLVGGLRDWYRYLSLETSPYSVAARRYTSQPDVDVSWVRPRSPLGRGLTALGGERPAAPGLPVAVVDHLARQLRKTLRIARYTQSPDFVLTERPF
ncbi:MAG TPA: hypothetical protein VNU71_21780 [Burkholderiaceae bacterium]|nr:hypothetical protein [Burkholderiaceae bacterium]